MKRIIALLAFGLALGACDKKEAPSQEAAITEKAPAPAQPATPAAEEDLGPLPDLSPDQPSTKLGEHPVAEDLEEEATRTISSDNLEMELERLEAEIDS